MPIKIIREVNVCKLFAYAHPYSKSDVNTLKSTLNNTLNCERAPGPLFNYSIPYYHVCMIASHTDERNATVRHSL
jgi:hypothetical protein